MSRGTPAPLKTITFPCTAPFAQYESRTKKALAQQGCILVPEPEHDEELEAGLPAVCTGAGEGLQMNGSYGGIPAIRAGPSPSQSRRYM